MNVDLLAALARLRADSLLDGAAKRRALMRDRQPGPSLRTLVARALRSFGSAAIDLGDAVAPRVL